MQEHAGGEAHQGPLRHQEHRSCCRDPDDGDSGVVEHHDFEAVLLENLRLGACKHGGDGEMKDSGFRWQH